MSKTSIELKRYNWDTKQEESLGEVNVFHLVRSIDNEQLAYFLGEYLNVGMKSGFGTGKTVGKFAQRDHRTIQGELIRFALGLIVSLSDQENTDARNEMPVEMGKKIAKMVEDGTLKMGWMI